MVCHLFISSLHSKQSPKITSNNKRSSLIKKHFKILLKTGEVSNQNFRHYKDKPQIMGREKTGTKTELVPVNSLPFNLIHVLNNR